MKRGYLFRHCLLRIHLYITPFQPMTRQNFFYHILVTHRVIGLPALFQKTCICMSHSLQFSILLISSPVSHSPSAQYCSAHFHSPFSRFLTHFPTIPHSLFKPRMKMSKRLLNKIAIITSSSSSLGCSISLHYAREGEK